MSPPYNDCVAAPTPRSAALTTSDTPACVKESMLLLSHLLCIASFLADVVVFRMVSHAEGTAPPVIWGVPARFPALGGGYAGSPSFRSREAPPFNSCSTLHVRLYLYAPAARAPGANECGACVCMQRQAETVPNGRRRRRGPAAMLRVDVHSGRPIAPFQLNAAGLYRGPSRAAIRFSRAPKGRTAGEAPGQNMTRLSTSLCHAVAAS